MGTASASKAKERQQALACTSLGQVTKWQAGDGRKNSPTGLCWPVEQTSWRLLTLTPDSEVALEDVLTFEGTRRARERDLTPVE
jgi:hypothetical protein